MNAPLLAFFTWWEKLGLHELTADQIINRYTLTAFAASATFSALAAVPGKKGDRWQVFCGLSGSVLVFSAVNWWQQPKLLRATLGWEATPLAIGLLGLVGALTALRQGSKRSATRSAGGAVIRWSVLALVVFACTTRLIRPELEYNLPLQSWRTIVAAVAIANWLALDTVARRRTSRLLLWWTLPSIGVATLMAGQAFGSLKDFLVLGSMCLTAAAAVQTCCPSIPFQRAAAALAAALPALVLGVFDAYNYNELSVALLLFTMATPSLLVVTELPRLRRDATRPWLQLTIIGVATAAQVLWLVSVLPDENW